MDTFRISFIVCTCIAVFILPNDGVIGQQDPCYFHQEINDTTMTLGFSLDPSDSAICDTTNLGWTRFTGSDEGLMSTECPSGRQCGTDQQVWMQGSIPSYHDGLTDVDICIRGTGDCCDRQNRMQVKNCNSFLVYNLVTIPPCARYCFNESSEMLVTVSTTSTTTTTPTTPTTTSSTTMSTSTMSSHSAPSSASTPTNTSTTVLDKNPTSTSKYSGSGCLSGSAVAGIVGVTIALIVTYLSSNYLGDIQIV